MAKYRYQLYYRKKGNKRWFKALPYPIFKKEIDLMFKREFFNVRDHEFDIKRVKTRW